MGAPDDLLRAVEARFEETVAELCDLARIPGVSAEGFDPVELERSARRVAELCTDAGLERVEVLRVPGAHPAVVAEWTRAGAGAPSVLFYAHHDVQPPGRLERWRTPPFEPARGADGRLYGRGVVDDKAGVVLQLAALRARPVARNSNPSTSPRTSIWYRAVPLAAWAFWMPAIRRPGRACSRRRAMWSVRR